MTMLQSILAIGATLVLLGYFPCGLSAASMHVPQVPKVERAKRDVTSVSVTATPVSTAPSEPERTTRAAKRNVTTDHHGFPVHPSGLTRAPTQTANPMGSIFQNGSTSAKMAPMVNSTNGSSNAKATKMHSAPLKPVAVHGKTEDLGHPEPPISTEWATKGLGREPTTEADEKDGGSTWNMRTTRVLLVVLLLLVSVVLVVFLSRFTKRKRTVFPITPGQAPHPKMQLEVINA